jgi:hypothetical protein
VSILLELGALMILGGKFLSAALEAIPPHWRLDAIDRARKIADQP